MSARGMPPNTDMIGIKLKLLGLRAQKTDRAFAVVQWPRKLHASWRQAVVNANATVAALNERHELVGAVVFRARFPATTVDIYDHGKRPSRQRLGTIDIQLELDIAPPPI